MSPQYFKNSSGYRVEEGQIKKWGEDTVGERVTGILRIGSNQTSPSF